MNEKQQQELNAHFAGWLEKTSVGCLVVGLFQPEHMMGGIIGSIVCFFASLAIKMSCALPLFCAR